MADKADIGAKIEIDGEKTYQSSLKAINAELKALKSEMDLATVSMDEMADTEESTAKKGEILEKTIDKQEQKLSLMNERYERSVGSLEELGKALTNAKEEFGANSAEVLKAQNAYNKSLSEMMNFKNEINKTNIEIAKSKKSLEELSESVEKPKSVFEELKEKTDDIGSSLKNVEKIAVGSSSGFDKFAEEAKQSADKANDSLSKLVESSKGKIGGFNELIVAFAGNILATAASAVVGAIGKLASSIVNLDEATEEVRENLSKVDSAFTTSGKSSESARKAYRDFYKILGDSDTAAESTQLLAQLAENEQDVDKWTRTATGVVATFGDSLPINSLIEASNETAKVGTVTGVLADALNWVGISEDEFNEKLAACGSEQERNALITETLAATYEDAAQAYEENNAGIMTARDLQAQLDESLANLGGTIQDVKNGLLADFLPSIVQIIDGFSDFVNGVDGADQALADGIGSMIDTIIGKLPEFLEFGIKVIGEIVKGLIMNLPNIIAASVKMVWTLITTIASLYPDIFNIGIDMLKQAADGAVTMIKEFVSIGTNLVSGLWEGIKEKSSWLKNQIRSWCSGIVDNVKDFFHINSPSRVFRDEIGQFLPEGLALGIDKGAKAAFDSMNSFNRQLLSAGEMIVPQASQSVQNQGLVESLINGLGVMQDKAVTVVAQVVLPNGEVLAETVFNDLLNVSKQRGVSLAAT